VSTRARLIAIPAALLVTAGGTAGVLVAMGQPGGQPASVITQSPSAQDNQAQTSLATIIRGDLSAQINVNGTLGYAGAHTVTNHTTGTYTSLPAAGKVFTAGDVLYRVDRAPVVLLPGSIPAYRTLARGISGVDVRQLNAALAALGYRTDRTSKYFGYATQTALEKLQAHLRATQTGELTLGQAVFLPGAIRVRSVQPVAGSTAMPGQSVFTASGTRRVVKLNLPTTQQTYIKVGNRVVITLADARTITGKITKVGAAAVPLSESSGTTATVPIEITPSHPARTGKLDQAPVLVAITTVTVHDALAVPINALVALAGGGYAVEIAPGTGGRRLVPVTPGMFDDAGGLVAISGDQLTAGMRVVVPST
jgi:peptidoglycan hydrolase-like protein with peptidoglycan-binding domain